MLNGRLESIDSVIKYERFCRKIVFVLGRNNKRRFAIEHDYLTGEIINETSFKEMYSSLTQNILEELFPSLYDYSESLFPHIFLSKKNRYNAEMTFRYDFLTTGNCQFFIPIGNNALSKEMVREIISKKWLVFNQNPYNRTTS